MSNTYSKLRRRRDWSSGSVNSSLESDAPSSELPLQHRIMILTRQLLTYNTKKREEQDADSFAGSSGNVPEEKFTKRAEILWLYLILALLIGHEKDIYTYF